MELNIVATGIELVGTTIKNITVENNIVDIEREAKRSFGLNIKEPYFEETEDGFFSQMTIDFEIEVEQSEDSRCHWRRRACHRSHARHHPEGERHPGPGREGRHRAVHSGSHEDGERDHDLQRRHRHPDSGEQGLCRGYRRTSGCDRLRRVPNECW